MKAIIISDADSRALLDKLELANMRAEPNSIMREGAAERRADAADRRCKRGKYAPPVGVCRVCGGAVTGKVMFPSDGRIGGPPRNGYVGSWSCDTCFVVYSQCPVPKPEETNAA